MSTEDSFNHCGTETLVKDVQKLLFLYDSILMEEYEPDLNIRNQIVSQPATLGYSFICDFCLGDIFQSFFECQNCGDIDHEPCHLCPGCYVEGRNCRCKQMKPMQSRNFQELIDLRTRSASAIGPYEAAQGWTPSPPLDLLCVFMANCIQYTVANGSAIQEFYAYIIPAIVQSSLYLVQSS